MAADEVLQLVVNLVQLDAKFARQIEKFLPDPGFAQFGPSHVEETPARSLKRIAHDPFGKRGFTP